MRVQVQASNSPTVNFLLSPQCNQPQAGHLAAACWQGTPQLVTKVKPVCGSTRPRKELWRPHISHLFSNKYKSLNPCFTWKDPTNRTTTKPHSSNYTGSGWLKFKDPGGNTKKRSGHTNHTPLPPISFRGCKWVQGV